MSDDVIVDSFTEWAEAAEPRLRHALTAGYGMQVGKDATAETLSRAWESWDDVRRKDDPFAYAYGIGRNVARRLSRRRSFDLPAVDVQRLPEVEPALPEAIAALPEQQRIVVALLYGYEWTMSEVGALLGIAKTTVQNHAERGLARLREQLGVER